jgi:pyridinium-3,5-bisthiocarboxylic acid mononucleotide nickel chelatase
VAKCEALIFRETTTLGIRHAVQERTILNRELKTVETPYGAVRVKVARYGDGGAIANLQPEYEDCVKLAKEQNVPWLKIHQAALSRMSDLQ